MLLGIWCCGWEFFDDVECLTGQPPLSPTLSKAFTIEVPVTSFVVGKAGGGADRNQDVHDGREEEGVVAELFGSEECFTGQPPVDFSDRKSSDGIVLLSNDGAVFLSMTMLHSLYGLIDTQYILIVGPAEAGVNS